jgi:hypothetical protein
MILIPFLLLLVPIVQATEHIIDWSTDGFPSTLSVEQGDTVKFVFDGFHGISFDDNIYPAVSQQSNINHTQEIQYVGTIIARCTVHSSMVTTITSTAAQTTTPTTSSNETYPPDDDDDKDLSSAQIVGVALASIIGLTAILLTGAYLFNKRNKPVEKKEFQSLEFNE